MNAHSEGRPNRGDHVKLTYAGAAEKFREALSALGAKAELQVTSKHDRPVSFFLQLELANCLVLSGSKFDEARGIYAALHEAFPKDPTVSFRYARALLRSPADKTDIQRACDLSKLGIANIEGDPMTGPGHWLPIAAQIQLGFADWNLARNAEEAHDQSKALEYVLDAVRETEKAYDLWNDLPRNRRKEDTHRLYGHKAASNLLYYLAEVLRLREGNDDSARQGIRKYMSILREEEVPMYESYYKTRDNLMHAHVALGELVEARELAGKNRGELRKLAEARAGHPLTFDVRTYLSAEEGRNWESASEVLADARETP